MNPRVIVGGLSAVVLAASIAAGFEGNKPTAYLDRLPLNPMPTACMGHTGADVVMGVTYSAEQCNAWLKRDMADANAIVHRCVGRDMPLGVEAALTDFTFNKGPGAKGVKDGFCVLKNGKPSTIRMKAIAGDWPGVCDQFQFWTKAGGVEYAGLVRRAKTDAAICRSYQ